MIFAALNHIHKNLNQHLQGLYEEPQEVAVISNVIEHDGSAVAYASNKLVLSLVQIEKDTLPQASGSGRTFGFNGKKSLHLNLYILILANFSGERYGEGLRMISRCINYFQRTPFFDHSNAPDLDVGIEKLILDIENVDFDNLPGIWNSVGGKCLPAIMYKVRMISVSDLGVEQRPGVLSTPLSNLQTLED